MKSCGFLDSRKRSSLVIEMQFPVRSLTCRKAMQLADAFLFEFAGETLQAEPSALDVLGLIEARLPLAGIHVQPEVMAQMGSCHGITIPDGNPGDDIDILLREDVYDDLVSRPGPMSRRARFTTCHEIAHALVHVPQVRRMRSEIGDEAVMARKLPRSQLKPWECQEWQADAIAGCMLAPVRQVRKLMQRGCATGEMASVFNVSRDGAEIQQKRIKEGKY